MKQAIIAFLLVILVFCVIPLVVLWPRQEAQLYVTEEAPGNLCVTVCLGGEALDVLSDSGIELYLDQDCTIPIKANSCGVTNGEVTGYYHLDEEVDEVYIRVVDIYKVTALENARQCISEMGAPFMFKEEESVIIQRIDIQPPKWGAPNWGHGPSTAYVYFETTEGYAIPREFLLELDGEVLAQKYFSIEQTDDHTVKGMVGFEIYDTDTPVNLLLPEATICCLSVLEPISAELLQVSCDRKDIRCILVSP